MKIARLKPYLRAMKRLDLDGSTMREIEDMIIHAPERHPMIKGLRGARKARFARPGAGKSGGGRVIYYIALKGSLLAMLAAYGKSEQKDLSSADRKAILRAIAILTSEGDQ